MKLLKFRWSKVYESSEEELTGFLHARQITSDRQEGEAFSTTGTKSFDQDTTLYCAEGSLVFQGEEARLSLQPGDALRVPAQLVFTLEAGMTGYVCYQATTNSLSPEE